MSLTIILLLGVVAAQIPVEVDTQQIVDLIDAAEREVLYSAPVLTQQEVADALHRAVTGRNVSLYVLVDGSKIELPGGYAPGFSTLPNALVAVAPSIEGGTIVIDDAVVIEGDAVFKSADVFGEAKTYALRDNVLAKTRSEAFNAQWRSAFAYIFDVEDYLGGLP